MHLSPTSKLGYLSFKHDASSVVYCCEMKDIKYAQLG